MGPSGYHKPPSLTKTSCLGYLLLLLGVILMPVEGFSQGEGCLVEACSGEYQIARQDLGIAEDGRDDSQAECTALRTYKHCITKTDGCEGNIMYYTLRNIVQQRMKEHNCTANGQTVEPSNSKPRETMVPAICVYDGPKTYRHCGLFGDPHLKTFYDEFQTCRVKGAWPLVNNDYLIVQVTNDPVEGNTDATATSKLTVIVKGNPECTSKDFQTYQAQTNSLPGSFDDGKISVGPYKSLELVEVEPGRHVEIHIRYINTVVVVRQIGRYFTFLIKMPEELVNQSSSNQDLQLCVRGCPQSELINYQEYLAARSDVSNVQASDGSAPAMSRSQAEELCREAKLVDFYFDSCVFDLLATGDQNFTLSALSSLQDVLKLYPSAARTMVNRTSLDTYDKQYGNSGQSVGRTQREHQVTLLLMLTLLISVLCSR